MKVRPSSGLRIRQCYFVVLATRKWFHPVLAIRPVSLSFSVVILFHFIMLADKFSNNNNNALYTDVDDLAIDPAVNA